MREILFRGKRTDNGKWTCGYLFCIWERSYLCWGTTNSVPNMDEVLPETVCQFTGLTDKNGRRIFEGDIVRTKFGRPCKVVWFSSREGSGWDLKPVDDSKPAPDDYDLWWSENLEIIGNIYDNPVLLEVKQNEM